MKVIKIDKTQWREGLDRLRGAFTLIGPVQEKSDITFRELAPGEGAR